MLEIGIATKINLLLLIIASCVPQVHRLRASRSIEGISLIYAYLNLFVATEQLAFGVHLCGTDSGTELLNFSPSLSTWLDICQFGIVWLYNAIFVYFCNRTESTQSKLRTTLSLVYALFVAVLVLACIIQASLPSNEHIFPFELLSAHLFCLSPLATTLAVVSPFFQARMTLSRSTVGTLSLPGLGLQAVVFALVGGAWVFRFPGAEGVDDDPMLWYQYVGWAAVDNLIFALTQGALFCVGWSRRGRDGPDDEQTALLP